MPALYAKLAARPAVTALALRFAIVAACRSGEVSGATWNEIDREAKLWVVPATRMKARKEPLSFEALAILDEAARHRQGEMVFPGGTSTGVLSNMSMLVLLRRMGRDDLTVHGFRSTFRDWVAEATHHQREIAEAALAHIVSGVEGAYQRLDMLEKRRTMMSEWAAFVNRDDRGSCGFRRSNS